MPIRWAGSSPTLARELNLEGQPVGAPFAPADGRFCSVSAFRACSLGLCVADFNCKELDLFNASGAAIGTSVNLMRLVGLSSNAAPNGMSSVRGGVAYFAIKPDLPRGNNVHEGFIFRVSGL